MLCECIEDAYPDKPLLPMDPIARNKKSPFDLHDRALLAATLPEIIAFQRSQLACARTTDHGSGGGCLSQYQ